MFNTTAGQRVSSQCAMTLILCCFLLTLWRCAVMDMSDMDMAAGHGMMMGRSMTFNTNWLGLSVVFEQWYVLLLIIVVVVDVVCCRTLNSKAGKFAVRDD